MIGCLSHKGLAVRSVHSFCLLAALAAADRTRTRCALKSGARSRSIVGHRLAGAEALDDCQVIARIDGQVVLACDVLWQVNRMIEENRDKIPPDKEAGSPRAVDEAPRGLDGRHEAALRRVLRNIPPKTSR